MKKYLLMLSLVMSGIFAYAGWVKGTVTYHNGLSESGYIKHFTKGDQKTVQFKKSESGSRQKIKSKELREITFNLPDGDRIIKNLKIKSENLKGKSRVSKNSIWLGVLYRGDFDVVGIEVYDMGYTMNYLVNWPGEKTASTIFVTGKGTSFAVGKKAFLRKASRVVFKGRCDSMVEAIEKETFMPKKLEDVIEYYETHCGSNSRGE
jgi:hypothetical protein